jgi:hypothetical protein
MYAGGLNHSALGVLGVMCPWGQVLQCNIYSFSSTNARLTVTRLHERYLVRGGSPRAGSERLEKRKGHGRRPYGMAFSSGKIESIVESPPSHFV